MTDDNTDDNGTVIHPSTDADGMEEVAQAVEWYDPDALTKHPRVHVTVTVECARATYTGTLKRFRRATTNDGGQTVNGWFAVLDREGGSGHINVYASPPHGGPSALRVYDYDGIGALPNKRPIESVTMEIDPYTAPRCPECGGEMVLGHSAEKRNRAMDADGSRGRWVGGTLCPDCFPGTVREDGEEGLP